MPKNPNGAEDESALRDQLVALDLQIADHSEQIRLLRKKHAQTIADLRACHTDAQRPMFAVMEVVEDGEKASR